MWKFANKYAPNKHTEKSVKFHKINKSLSELESQPL